MYCNKCGKPLKQDGRFCDDCRRELEAMLASDAPAPKPNKKKSKALTAGLIAGGVVVLLVTAVIMLLTQPWSQAKPQTEETESEKKYAYVLTESITTYASGTQTRDVYTYDEDGNQVRKYSYLADGSCQEIVEYICNSDGVVIGTVTTQYGNVTEEEAWEEDKDGKKLWESTKKHDEYFVREQKNVHTYSCGKWIKTERYTAVHLTYLGDEGELELHSYGEAKYHEGGMIATWYRADGSLMSTIEDVYNEDGKTELRMHYNNEGILYLKEVWSYKDYGKVSQYKRTDENDVVEYTIDYTYDKRGNKISECKKDAEGNLVHEIQYTYLRVDKLPEEYIESRENEES